MEHPTEKLRALWLEVSQHVSANDHELEDKAAFLQRQEQKFINVIEASRKLDKHCNSYEQRERDEAVHYHFQKLYGWRRRFGNGVTSLSWTNIGGTIAGDLYFSAH